MTILRLQFASLRAIFEKQIGDESTERPVEPRSRIKSSFVTVSPGVSVAKDRVIQMNNYRENRHQSKNETSNTANIFQNTETASDYDAKCTESRAEDSTTSKLSEIVTAVEESVVLRPSDPVFLDEGRPEIIRPFAEKRRSRLLTQPLESSHKDTKNDTKKYEIKLPSRRSSGVADKELKSNKLPLSTSTKVTKASTLRLDTTPSTSPIIAGTRSGSNRVITPRINKNNSEDVSSTTSTRTPETRKTIQGNYSRPTSSSSSRSIGIVAVPRSPLVNKPSSRIITGNHKRVNAAHSQPVSVSNLALQGKHQKDNSTASHSDADDSETISKVEQLEL